MTNISDSEIQQQRSISKFLYDEELQKGTDELIFNPFNPLNIKITLSEVQSILTKYNLPPIVNNLALYQRAFVHRSYTKRPDYENQTQKITIVEKPDDCLPLSTKSNERLEFVGDGILEAITKYYLYRRFPKADEGFMTEKKIAIVKNESIGKIAKEMGLHKWIMISRHAEEKKIRTNDKKLGCLFEAFLGALFLDMNKIKVNDENNWFQDVFVTGPGFQLAQKFIETIFEKHIDWTSLIKNDDNYKNIFQVKIQKEFKVTPEYIIIENDPEFGYKMGVYLCIGYNIHNDDVNHNDALDISVFGTIQDIHDYVEENSNILMFISEGQHKIKRKAEQIACQIAINNPIFK